MAKIKTVTVKQDPETKDGFLDLEDFKDFVDVKKVKSYTLEAVQDDSDVALILKFYDKKGNVIDCKE